MKKITHKFSTQQIELVRQSVIAQLANTVNQVACRITPDLLEVVYVPMIKARRIGPFGVKQVNVTDETLNRLVAQNYFKGRNGSFGPVMKEVVHVKSGVGVNLRMVTEGEIKELKGNCDGIKVTIKG